MDDTLATLADDGFRALEARQAVLCLRRLDAMLEQLDELDLSLSAIIESQSPRAKSDRKESITIC